MALETRDGRKYYYRSRRIEGRVVKEYVASGQAAENAAKRDKEAREQRRIQRKETEQLEAELAKVTQVVEAISERSEVLLAASLLTAGFHQHKSEWRRSRDRKRKENV